MTAIQTMQLSPMRPALALLAFALFAHAQEPLPPDVAARHPEGKWSIRKADFYRYLVRYHGNHPSAKATLPDFMKRRLVEEEARLREVTVTDRDVDRFMADLDKEIRQRTGGLHDLEKEYKRHGMSREEFRRRCRSAIVREHVARDHMNRRDPTRKKDKRLDEGTVTLVIDQLYRDAAKVIDPGKLPPGKVARIGKVEITEYEYGRELAYALPATEVARVLREVILVEETKLLLGNDDPPSEEELESQKRWFLSVERARLERVSGGKQRITDEMVGQVIQQRGLTLEEAFANPAFLAQARGLGHYRRGLDEDALREFYDKNKDRYSDKLRVARILLIARAQRVPMAGRKVRTLQEGKALADALWIRATQGQEFAALAAKNSDDPDPIKKNGGVVPLWLTADTPGFEDTWAQANALEAGALSRPFFSQGRGYVIVKLVERRKALGFEAMRKRLREDAAHQAYGIWRNRVVRDALKSATLLD